MIVPVMAAEPVANDVSTIVRIKFNEATGKAWYEATPDQRAAFLEKWNAGQVTAAQQTKDWEKSIKDEKKQTLAAEKARAAEKRLEEKKQREKERARLKAKRDADKEREDLVHKRDDTLRRLREMQRTN